MLRPEFEGELTMPEFRQNMLTNEWVIIATERAKRLEDFQQQEAEKPPLRNSVRSSSKT